MTSKQQRTKAGLTLLSLAFTYYNNYISSHALLENCADHIYQHKDQYLNLFSRRTVQPLRRLTGDTVRDRRLLVSFLRRVAKLINNGILIKRGSQTPTFGDDSAWGDRQPPFHLFMGQNRQFDPI